MAEKICSLKKSSSGSGGTDLDSNGYQTVNTITCKVDDLIAITSFHTGSHASVSGGDLIGAWTERDVGGSTFLGCGMFRATATTVTVSAIPTYMAVITTS